MADLEAATCSPCTRRILPLSRQRRGESGQGTAPKGQRTTRQQGLLQPIAKAWEGTTAIKNGGKATKTSTLKRCDRFSPIQTCRRRSDRC